MYNKINYRKLYLNLFFLQFFISVFFLFKFDFSSNLYKQRNNMYIYDFFVYNLNIDVLSIFFIILTSLIMIICVLINWNLKYKVREFLNLLYVINFMLLNVFLIFDLFLFYVYFEFILIPMFLLIGIWGSRERKIQAAYKFFIYTLFGSLFMIIAILNIYYHFGTCDLQILQLQSISEIRQIIIAICFMIAFSVKVPMFPVHLWLPEAHVEASTTGSVILASILLKLGTYAILRFMVPLFPAGLLYISPFLFLFALLSIIYASLSALRQTDLKRIVAYSSIAHMNFVILGIFSMTLQGIEGSLFLMFSHALVSSALFISVGFLYDRYKTRIIVYYSGLAQLMPVFSLILFLFILSNFSFPGTSSFVGEFLVLISCLNTNNVVGFWAATSICLSVAYSLWFFNRICFGNLNDKFLFNFSDITLREFAILLPLLFLNFFMGLFTTFFSDKWYGSVIYYSLRI